MYSGLHGEQDNTGGPSKAMLEGRKRGVLFDVGHGGGSFTWGVAVPLMYHPFQRIAERNEWNRTAGCSSPDTI
jgi:hypothetical protein